MIKIEITRVTTETYKATENFLVEKIPTAERSHEYSTEKVVFHEKNEPREVSKERSVTVKLLTQEIENDQTFNLERVIQAINNIM